MISEDMEEEERENEIQQEEELKEAQLASPLRGKTSLGIVKFFFFFFFFFFPTKMINKLTN